MYVNNYIELLKPNIIGYIKIEVCITIIACFGLFNEEDVGLP